MQYLIAILKNESLRLLQILKLLHVMIKINFAN